MFVTITDLRMYTVVVFMLIIMGLRILELKKCCLKPAPLFFRFPKCYFSFSPLGNRKPTFLVNYDEVLGCYWQPRCDITLMTNGYI